MLTLFCSSNNLSDENKDQDQNDEKHREALRLLLEKFEVQDIFGLVDKHKHFDVPHGCHLVGTFGALPGLRFYFIHTVADKTSNPNELCGHKFTYIPGIGLRPYEFRPGPLLDKSEVDPEFFSQFINYLNEHKITSIGLEYTVPEVSDIVMHEIVLKRQRYMVLVERTWSLSLPNQFQRVPTCWRWLSKPRTISGEAVWCDKDKTTGGHIPPNDLPADIHLILAAVGVPQD
jgi:hypothetical protein